MFPNRYRPHDAFIAPARATAELWRLALGLMLGAFAMTVVARMILSTAVLFVPEPARESFTEALWTGNTPAALTVVLLSIASIAVAAAFVAQVLHRRRAVTLIGPPGLALRQFWQVLKGLALLALVLIALPPWGWSTDLDALRPVSRWLWTMPLGIAAILIQTASEEIAFRGYIQQQVAARFAAPVVWLCVPSALFALAHYDASHYGDHAWLVVLWTFLFGVAAADLVARSGTIGPAVALHFANNAYAMLLVASDASLRGFALYALPVAPGDDTFTSLLMLDLAVLGLSWLTARLMLRA